MIIIWATYLILTAINISGEDILIPENSALVSSYKIMADKSTGENSCIIHRNIYNGSDNKIDSIILLANLPLNAEAVDYSIDGDNIDIMTQGPLDNHIMDNSTSYIWTIKPDLLKHLALLESGESLKFSYVVSGDVPINTIFPPHAAIFYSGDKEVYSVSDSINLNIGSVDNSDIDSEGSGGRNYKLTTSVSPNPFNSTVNIQYSMPGMKGRDVKIAVIDILGRTVYKDKFVSPADGGTIDWTPVNNIASGVYFYRLTFGDHKSEGKLLYLK